MAARRKLDLRKKLNGLAKNIASIDEGTKSLQ